MGKVVTAVANDLLTSLYASLSIVCPMQFRPEDTAASGPSPKVETKNVEDFTYLCYLILKLKLQSKDHYFLASGIPDIGLVVS